MVAVVEATRGVSIEEGAEVADQSALASDQLRSKVSGALRWSFMNSAFSRVGQLALGIVLARLIAPDQFGVYAAALVVINIILSISELGVSVALVRHTGDISSMAPTVTTLSLASGGVLAVVCFAGAPWFADALGAPEARGVIQLMSVAVLFAGASAVPGAILQREFRQDHKLFADTLSFVVNAGVAVALALNHFGPWALAWSRVAANITATVVMFVLTKERYGPGFDRAQARALLAFGLPLAGSSLLVFAVLNVDYIVVGAVLGPVSLGLYLMAFNLSSWPVGVVATTIRGVSMAGFSHLRDDPQKFRESFSNSLSILMALSIPACVWLAALGRPLVRFVYGDRWEAAAAALAILSILGALRVALELSYDYLAAAGRSTSILAIHVLWLIGLVPALAVGAHLDGIRGVGWGHVVTVALLVTPAYGWALHRIGVDVWSVLGVLARPVFGGAVMFVVATYAQRLVDGDPAKLMVGGTLSTVAYALVMWPIGRLALTRRAEHRTASVEASLATPAVQLAGRD